MQLFKGGRVFAPESKGAKDVLVHGGRILKVAEQIDPPPGFQVETKDMSDNYLVPGYIDPHVHVTGGGGEAGPTSRVPEVQLADLTKYGVTTVVGLLGTDNVSRHPETLLAKVKALNEHITAFMYTGSYHLPPDTVTGSVKKDIALIGEILGLKVAISDHRISPPQTGELSRFVASARVGGMLGNKPGIVHAHVGEGGEGLEPIFSLLQKTEIPPAQFHPTHLSRNRSLLDQGIRLLRKGGYIDLTAPGEYSGLVEKIGSLITYLLEEHGDLSRVTLSSDGNGSAPEFDEEGNLMSLSQGRVSVLHDSLRELVQNDVLKLESALSLLTVNPAKRLGLEERKGRIEEGRDADLLVLDPNLMIRQVYAKGRTLVDEGEPVIKGEYE